MIHQNYINNLLERTQRHPERIAINEVGSGIELNYFQLKSEVERFIAYFNHIGIAKHDNVLLLLNSNLQTQVAFYALSSIGAVGVFLNTNLHTTEMEVILDNAQISFCIAGNDNYDKFKDFLYSRNELKAIALPDMAIDKAVVEEVTPKLKVYKGVSNELKRTELQTIDTNLVVSVAYTYKGKGKPIPVPHTMDNFSAALRGVATTYRALPSGEKKQVLSILPLYSIFGLFMTALLPIYRGGTIIYAADQISQLPAVINMYKPDFLHVVPSLLKILQSMLPKANVEGNGMLIMAGGAYLDPALQQAFTEATGIEVANGYGTTEIMPYTTNYTTHAEGSIGKGEMENTKVEVRSNGEIVDANILGTIYIKVPWLPLTSWNNDTSLSEFIEDGWFNTGDMGYKDEHGNLYVETIQLAFTKIKGMMVDMKEVETVIERLPQVEKAKVFTKRGQWHETELVAHVKGNLESKAALKKYLQQSIANYKIPKAIEIINI